MKCISRWLTKFSEIDFCRSVYGHLGEQNSFAVWRYRKVIVITASRNENEARPVSYT
jgi:hypothetical protein